jgi:hypothetical protein
MSSDPFDILLSIQVPARSRLKSVGTKFASSKAFSNCKLLLDYEQ